eukprot:10315036-Prorocentrum_lima.AAC.1
MTSSLVGSEMCIRDRSRPTCLEALDTALRPGGGDQIGRLVLNADELELCLLYTSDAADDM